MNYSMIMSVAACMKFLKKISSKKERRQLKMGDVSVLLLRYCNVRLFYTS